MKTVFRLFRHRRLSGQSCKQIGRRLIVDGFLPNSSSDKNGQDVCDDERVKNFLWEERPLANTSQTHWVRHRWLIHLHWNRRWHIRVSMLGMFKFPISEETKKKKTIQLVRWRQQIDLWRFMSGHSNKTIDRKQRSSHYLQPLIIATTTAFKQERQLIINHEACW